MKADILNFIAGLNTIEKLLFFFALISPFYLLAMIADTWDR